MKKQKHVMDEFNSTLKELGEKDFQSDAMWELLADIRYYAKDMLEARAESRKSPLLFNLNVCAPAVREFEKMLQSNPSADKCTGNQISAMYHILEHSTSTFSNYVHDKESDAEYFYTYIMNYLYNRLHKIDENVIFCADKEV